MSGTTLLPMNFFASVWLYSSHYPSGKPWRA